jgi:hypothetical protein
MARSVESGLNLLLKARWDLPYRWLASILAIAAMVGWRSGASALATLRDFVSTLGAQGASNWFGDADAWTRAHVGSELVGILLVAAIAFGTAACYSDEVVIAESRAAASVWIAIALAAYRPALWWWIALVSVAAAGLRICSNAAKRGGGPTVGEWILGTAVNLGAAALWLPASLGLWAFAGDGAEFRWRRF